MQYMFTFRLIRVWKNTPSLACNHVKPKQAMKRDIVGLEMPEFTLLETPEVVDELGSPLNL